MARDDIQRAALFDNQSVNEIRQTLKTLSTIATKVGKGSDSFIKQFEAIIADQANANGNLTRLREQLDLSAYEHTRYIANQRDTLVRQLIENQYSHKAQLASRVANKQLQNLVEEQKARQKAQDKMYQTFGLLPADILNEQIAAIGVQVQQRAAALQQAEAKQEKLSEQIAELQKKSIRSIQEAQKLSILKAQKQELRKSNAEEKRSIADKKKQLKFKEKNLQKSNKAVQKAQQRAIKQRTKQQGAERAKAMKDQLNSAHTIGGKLTAIKNIGSALSKKNTGLTKEEKSATANQLVHQAAKMAANVLQQLGGDITTIAKKKTAIATNMQGSKEPGWEVMNAKLALLVGVSPWVRQADVANAIETLAGMGITYNIQQRAFLNVIKDKIATTFDSTNGTLLRLVRIQQQDTSAARLGMEAALTSFLNNMYETSQYMHTIATQIKSSLEESMALMQAKYAVTFEHQVHKWTGSMYSVGMSDNAVQSIATALGQLASGDISGLGQGASNLLVMAANRDGQSIGQILTEGLDTQKQTSALLRSAVEYLGELYQGSKDSLVVQQELAKVYGLKASDLLAASHISSEKATKAIEKQKGTYAADFAQLMKQGLLVGTRTSLPQILQNIEANFKYGMSSMIANNPVLYAMYKFIPLLENIGDGIPIPFINAMGFGFDLHMSVSDIMSIAALSGAALGGIAGVPSGLAQVALGALPMMLGYGLSSQVGKIKRGSGAVSRSGGASISASGYAGNASDEDIKSKTMADAEKDGKQQVQQASEQLEEATSTDINENVIKIYQLLLAATTGGAHFHMKVDDYGLTGFN